MLKRLPIATLNLRMTSERRRCESVQFALNHPRRGLVSYVTPCWMLGILDTTTPRPILRPNGRMNPAENFVPGTRQHLLDRLRRLSWLSQEQIREIADASQLLEIKRGDNIYAQGDSANTVYIIL